MGLNSTVEKMYLNLLMKDFIKSDTKSCIENIGLFYDSITYNLEFNTYNYYINSFPYFHNSTPKPLLHLKKFFRKITFDSEYGLFVFTPKNSEIEKILLFS